MAEDRIICNCMEVYESSIVEALKSKGLHTVEEVGEATEAGTICGACQDEIQEIIDRING